MARENVRSAVANRKGDEIVLADVRERITKAKGWFARVVPSHIDPDQFVHIGLGILNKDPRLAGAAIRNPDSFMVALSECARLGLVPGETFHLTWFTDNSSPAGISIVGMVDYKGEIDMMYRAGGVVSVHCQVVRAHDQFRWRPGMDLPYHVIDSNDFGQEGLADESERGPLTGVYAWAKLMDGDLSDVIVMPKSEVMKHRAAAKTMKFWEGTWEQDMWLKTALHKLFDRVPHSAEYMREKLKAQAVELPVDVKRPELPAAEEALASLAVTASPAGTPEPGGEVPDADGS